MASANMKDIKRRIKSIESTMQITKAMELVASSKLRKAKEKAEKAKPFFDTLYETMCEIAGSNKDFTSIFTSKRKINTVALIVIAGDRGLAGGFNSNVLKPALLKAKQLESENKKVKIIPIGKKAVDFFEKRGFDINDKYAGVGETVNIYDAMVISGKIINGFKKKEIDSVELFYTTFLSAMSQEQRTKHLLPVSSLNNVETTGFRQLTEYEPSAEAVFNSIVPQYLAGIIFSAIVDSFAAEQASRRTAMESASDNAGAMIDNLSLIYNRARQASITQEITEIVSGSQI